MKHPRLSLGPVLYYWPREQLYAFYQAIAQTPIDIVYLGEVICAKRRSFRQQDWLTVARMLQQAGKQVVWSTLSLIESGAELGALERLCATPDDLIEANDFSAVQLCQGRPFVAGYTLNLYNHYSLGYLAHLGLYRWVMPVELSCKTLTAIHMQRPSGVETEVLVYGRLPLSYSARCFTARAHQLPKDHCEFRCQQDPDGLLLSTGENQPFLVLNGIQTQSAAPLSLLAELPQLVTMGIDVLRISPQSQYTAEIIQLFKHSLNNLSDLPQAIHQLSALMPLSYCNGYWHGQPGMQQMQQKMQQRASTAPYTTS